MSIWSREIIRFIIVGLINTTGGLAIIFFCMALGLGDVLANLAGYTLGIIISYILNGKWTFRRTALGHGEFGRFLFVIASAYLINLAVMLSVRDGLGLGSVIGQLAGVATYAVIGFIGMKYLAFRSV